MKQNKCILIGLTGGIASGKSTVSSTLREKGYTVIDADKIAREVVEIDKPAYKEIVNFFGNEILCEDRTINRKILGRIIFNDESLRKKLNTITHPYIFQEIKRQINLHCSKKNLVFLDIPLLFEEYEMIKKYNICFDEIWLVYVDKNTQIRRLMDRDLITKEEALSKINSQMSLEKKREKSTRIINNQGDLLELKDKIEDILNKLN